MYNFFINKIFYNKSLFLILQSVPNIGKLKALFICKSTGLLPGVPIKFLTDSQMQALAVWIDSTFLGSYSINHSFVKKVKSHRGFLKKLGHIRKSRYFFGLPVRGQRTRTNAKVCKSRKTRLLIYQCTLFT